MEALTNIYLSNSILCVLLGLYFLLSTAQRPLPSRIFGLNYLLYAIQSVLAVLVLTDSWKFASLLRPVLALALGPAFYLYYICVGKPDRGIEPHHLLHFFPVPLLGLAMVFTRFIWFGIDYLIIGSFAIYLGVAIFILAKGTTVLSHLGHSAKTAYFWLCVLASLMAINLLIEILVVAEIQWGVALDKSQTLLVGSGFFLLVNALTVLLALRRTPLIEWMNAVGEERIVRHLKPQLSDPQAQEIFEKFEQLVKTKQLHKRDGGLTVKQAARMLTLPVRQLSESVNRIYGGSFSQYLNDQRVAEAMRLIENNPELPITDLMLEAGFATKSNFNKEFSRVTKMSPTEYRKQILRVTNTKGSFIET